MPIRKKINQEFFKNWSHEMAYILGFFTADGNMIKNKRGAHFIELQITDKYLLESIRKVLKSDHKITSRKRGSKWKTSHRLQIGSQQIYRDLISLGLTPNKSKTIDFPTIPQGYLSDFVRGYFDGDGHVTVSYYIRANRKNKKCVTIVSGFTSGSKRFLEKLHSKLKEHAKISGGSLYHHQGYRLYFSVRDSLALYKFLYHNVKGLYLGRKKQVFEKYFDMGR